MVDQIKRLKARFNRVKDRLLQIRALQLIYLTAEELGAIYAAHRAAGVAYYALLSVFPLILGLIAILGFFLGSGNLQDQLLNFVSSSLPGATDILKQNIISVIKLRGTLGVLSVIGLLWSASVMFSAISLAINRVWNIRQVHPFFIRKARDLGMVLGIGLLFVLSLGASAVISIVPAVDMILVNLGSRLVAFLLMLAVFLLLYKLVPNTRTYWRYIWPGALLAAVLFEIARSLFVFYLENFANYQLIYGSIASIIILLVWTYYSAFIMILGAEFTFQYGRMCYSVTTGSDADK
jgi:membrane protein